VTHYYNIHKWGVGRFKHPCRVLVRGHGRKSTTPQPSGFDPEKIKAGGPRNILIEFADGQRMVTIRNAARRITNNSTIRLGTVDR
jgi:hypothetical protein